MHVQIVDSTIVEDIGRVRGKLASGGWISLVNLETLEQTWAVPLDLGTYELAHDTDMNISEDDTSRVHTKLYKGQFIEVQQTKVMEGVARVRGKLFGGGWISLVNFNKIEKFWHTPVKRGLYEIVGDGTVTESEIEDQITLSILEKGQVVEIVEVRHIADICRIRGRLAGGGWISLVNLATSEKMALPAGLASRSSVGHSPSRRGSDPMAGHSNGQHMQASSAAAPFNDEYTSSATPRREPEPQDIERYTAAIERLYRTGATLNAPPGWQNTWHEDVLSLASWRRENGERHCGLPHNDPCLYELIRMHCETHNASQHVQFRD